MSLRSILFILIKYLDHDSLIVLSKVIFIPEYIYDSYLIHNFGISISLKNIIDNLHYNSIKASKHKLSLCLNLNIDRFFEFNNKTSYTYLSINKRIYQHRYNEEKELDYDDLQVIFRKPKFDRITLDYKLYHYSEDEIEEIGFENIYEIEVVNSRERTRLRLLHSRYLKKDTSKLTLDPIDYNINELIDHSYDSLIVKNRCKIFNFNDKYVFYSSYLYNTATKTTKIVVRDTLKELLALLTDNEKIEVLTIEMPPPLID